MGISSRKEWHNFRIKVRPFSGAIKVSCMVDHVKPTMRHDKPDIAILNMEAIIIIIIIIITFILIQEKGFTESLLN